jgi:hypothetical protein
MSHLEAVELAAKSINVIRRNLKTFAMGDRLPSEGWCMGASLVLEDVEAVLLETLDGMEIEIT